MHPNRPACMRSLNGFIELAQIKSSLKYSLDLISRTLTNVVYIHDT